MASNFSYLNTDFNEIFASNSLDFNYNKTVSVFTTNNIAKTYNATNGSTTQQNNISYYYNNNTTNFSSGIQAYYIEYFYGSGTQYTIIPDFCKKIRYFLVGAGGSGGAGGGDNEGKKGTDGAGGGGGGYSYGEISVTSGVYIFITIGKGGPSVKGGQPNSNNGNVGISGGDTVLNYNDIANYIGQHGTGGDGGHPSSTAGKGIGGTGNIENGNGSNSSGMTGGLSGYSNFNNAGNFATYFRPYSTASYGNGGNGTSGGYDPNSSLTGAGGNGYARIYFMA